MRQHAILHHQGCGGCLRIFHKQTIVADAEADNYIQIRLLPVQYLRLQDRIAHTASQAGVHLIQSDKRLINLSYLASGSIDLKPLLPVIFCNDPAFPDQSDTGGNSNFFRSNAFRKESRLLQPGLLTVEIRLNRCRRIGDLLINLLSMIKC